jgi:hypothetical protein
MASKAVTLMAIDHRRKMPFHVYCATCQWTYESRDMVDAHKSSKAHSHEPKSETVKEID